MRTFPIHWIATIFFFLSSPAGCRKSSNSFDSERQSEVKLERSLPDQDELPPLVFDIKPIGVVSSSANSQLYDCTYQSAGVTARFRLQFAEGTMSGGRIPTASAEGKFLAVAGSNDAMLLKDLKRILDAKQPATNVSKIHELAFDAVVLGRQQSRLPLGGYSSHPLGDWTLTKIFLPKGGDEGEVFFNFNPIVGKAEFSIKDSDYGDYVLKELAKVL